MQKLKICTLEYPTNDSIEITFKLEENQKKQYNHKPGQYLSVNVIIDGKEFSRCYSITGIDKEGKISICVKRVPNGIVSNYLFEKLKVDDELIVSLPEGNFTLNRSNNKKGHSYIFVTGGSGITPLIPMLNELIKDSKYEKIHLIYGNRDEESIIYKALLNRYSHHVNVIHVLEKAPSTIYNAKFILGILSQETITNCLKTINFNPEKTYFFLSGPPIVIENSLKAIGTFKVKEKNVFLERFFVDSSKFADGKEHLIRAFTSEGVNKIEVRKQTSILDACLDVGKNIDHSCKSGDCKRCTCRLLKGEVNFDGNIINSKKDILACQSFPLNDDVIVDFRKSLISKIIKHRTYILISLFVVSLISFFTLRNQAGETFIANGPMNTGHEHVSCAECHRNEKGTMRQQLQSNTKHLFSDKKGLYFGKLPVTNNECLECHKRENDIHPVHRFTEPKFKAARNAIHPEKCISCHMEHEGKRVTISNTNYCINCHKNISLKDEVINPTHESLAASNSWSTCLQCHDFHGNHIRFTSKNWKDTIPQEKLKLYFEGGTDPYSLKKRYKSLKK